jgi:hypothetical protein
VRRVARLVLTSLLIGAMTLTSAGIVILPRTGPPLDPPGAVVAVAESSGRTRCCCCADPDVCKGHCCCQMIEPNSRGEVVTEPKGAALGISSSLVEIRAASCSGPEAWLAFDAVIRQADPLPLANHDHPPVCRVRIPDVTDSDCAALPIDPPPPRTAPCA